MPLFSENEQINNQAKIVDSLMKETDRLRRIIAQEVRRNKMEWRNKMEYSQASIQQQAIDALERQVDALGSRLEEMEKLHSRYQHPDTPHHTLLNLLGESEAKLKKIAEIINPAQENRRE
jgi:DNA repair exonuclease SbcCD ATPase subunit